MPAARHITFILNPHAGRGRAKHLEPELVAALRDFPFSHTLFVTTTKGEATSIALSESKTSSVVVAVGGDGTVNEVASGLIGSHCALGVISVGSGNDFARTIGATNDVRQMLMEFSLPNVKKFDVGTVRLTHIHGRTEDRFFFNSLGIGFDAAVAKRVTSIKLLRGIPLYMSALISTLVGYKPHFFAVTTPERKWEKNYFLLCIGIGKWEGGGFKLTPDAVPDDGKYQVCGITGDSILKVLPVLPSVMTGTHIGKEYIEVFDTAVLSAESPLPVTVHGDGEIFGDDILKIEVSTLPSRLHVVVTKRVQKK